MNILTSTAALWMVFLSVVLVLAMSVRYRSALLSLAVVIATVLMIYAVSGTPRPVYKEWVRPFIESEKVEVLQYVLREDVAIYLWLNTGEEPLNLALPWDREQAQELQDAWEEGEGSAYFQWQEPSLDDGPRLFHPPPQPAPTPKPAPVTPPRYERPA